MRKKNLLLTTPPRRKRQYKYLYSKMLQRDTIIEAWKNLRKGKTRRRSVTKIEKNFEKEILKMQEKIKNTKPDGCVVEHPELAYEPPKVRKTKIVHELTKKRTAYLADIREQWYFHIIVEVLKPIIMGRLQPGVCGCIPKRGMHFGRKKIQRVIKNNKVRYFFKCDIRHFYDNVRISEVIKIMRDYIADELFLYCIEKIYKYIPKGILIGLYISPWIANFMLMHIDDTICQNEQFSYFRYVDDIVIIGKSKKELKEISVVLLKMLGQLKLKVKRNYQIVRFDYIKKNGMRIGRPLDFMGFLFFRERTLMRKHIMLNTVRTAKMIHDAKINGRRIWEKLARSFLSLIGWFKWTDSYYCYLEHIKPYVRVGYIKKIISKLDKEARKNDRNMEERNLCYTT